MGPNLLMEIGSGLFTEGISYQVLHFTEIQNP